MDPKIKKQWVKALRSGEYEQGRGRLCNAKGQMCCLGVLADIAVEGDWVFSKDHDSWSLQPDDGGPPEVHFLPDTVCDKLGLSAAEVGRLAQLNDGTFDNPDHRSFDQIADYIESPLFGEDFLYDLITETIRVNEGLDCEE